MSNRDVVWIEEPASEQTTTCSEIAPPSEDGLEPDGSVVFLENSDAQTIQAFDKKDDEKAEQKTDSLPPRPFDNGVKEEVDEEASNGSSTLVEESQPSVSPKESVVSTQLLTTESITTTVQPESSKEGISGQEGPESQPIVAPNRVRFVEELHEKEGNGNTKAQNDEVLELNKDCDSNESQPVKVTDIKTEQNTSTSPTVSETELQLDEYERKLRENTKQALELVDRLCEQQAQEQTARTPRDTATTAFPDANLAMFTVGELSNGDEIDVDSLRVNQNLMKYPVDCLVLPGRKVLVLDEDFGLMLLSLETKIIIRAQLNEQWRKPACAIFIRETQHILVLAECSVGSTTLLSPPGNQNPEESLLNNGAAGQLPAEQGTNPVVKAPTYERFICRFDLDLKLINKIEAPKYIRDKVVISCRMCYVEQTKSIYMAVSTPSQGFLYELNVGNKWTEVYNSRGHNFSDVQSFAVVGPITELLLVETNRSYVLLVSIYSSQVVDRRMIAVCERADTLTIDETGNLFVFDRATCKIAHHSRLYFEKLREIALVERAHCRISAAGGLLAVLNKQFKELKLYRYQ